MLIEQNDLSLILKFSLPDMRHTIDWGDAFDDALIRLLELEATPASETQTRLVSLFANGSADSFVVQFDDVQSSIAMSAAILDRSVMEPMALWWASERTAPFVIGSPTWHAVKIEKKRRAAIRRAITAIEVSTIAGKGAGAGTGKGTGRDGLAVTTWLWKGGHRHRRRWCSFDTRHTAPEIVLYEALLSSAEGVEALSACTHAMLKALGNRA